jgi:hypothetical protein
VATRQAGKHHRLPRGSFGASRVLAMAHSYPKGYLPLADAFAQVLSALTDGEKFARLGSEVTVDLNEFEQRPGPETVAAFVASDQRDVVERRVELLMRNGIADGLLIPFLKASNGQIEQIVDREEFRKMAVGVPGIDNVPDPVTNPGPDTDGRPVLLAISNFEEWLATHVRRAHHPDQAAPGAPVARPFDLSVARPFGSSIPRRRDDRISDPIPEDGIGLSEARKKWLRELVHDFDALDEKAGQAIERLKRDQSFEAHQAAAAVANEQEAEHLKADIIVRKALIAGKITAFISNDRGDRLKLAAAEWIVDSGIDSHRDANGTIVSVEVPNAGFGAASDYVWPGATERSGPDTRLAGSSRPNAHRRVFFQQREFQAWLVKRRSPDLIAPNTALPPKLAILAAVAWVSTGDAEFVESVHRRKIRSSLKLDLELASRGSSGISAYNAWNRLYNACSAASVSWASGSRFTRDGGIETSAPQDWIPADELNSLELDESNNCLVAKDTTCGHPMWGRAWGYRDVLFSAERLLEGFPAASLSDEAVDRHRRPPQMVTFPPPIVPHGNGTMSLTAAAHWIASQGGKVAITDAHENEWLLAFDNLLRAIHRAEVDFNLIGRARESGKYESVSAIYLKDRPREYEFLSTSDRNPNLSEDRSAKEFIRLSSCFVEEDRESGYNDKIFVGGRSEWTHLHVNMGAVAAVWPFHLALSTGEMPTQTTSSTTDCLPMDKAVGRVGADKSPAASQAVRLVDDSAMSCDLRQQEPTIESNPRRKRGPKGRVKEQLIDQMLTDIAEQNLTWDELYSMKGVELENRYGTKTTTTRDARIAVLLKRPHDK